jgi:hypothetical protein
VLFAHDQLAGASRHQQYALAAEAPGSAVPVVKPRQHGQVRRFVDKAAADLTSPFNSLVQSQNTWIRHGVPAAVAMLVYGLGLGMLARYAQSDA